MSRKKYSQSRGVLQVVTRSLWKHAARRVLVHQEYVFSQKVPAASVLRALKPLLLPKTCGPTQCKPRYTTYENRTLRFPDAYTLHALCKIFNVLSRFLSPFSVSDATQRFRLATNPNKRSTEKVRALASLFVVDNVLTLLHTVALLADLF